MRRREYEELPGIKREKSRSNKFRRLIVLEILAVLLIALIPIPLIAYKQSRQSSSETETLNIDVSADNETSTEPTLTPEPR